MDFISILSIFVLACFVGYYVVWSVTHVMGNAVDLDGETCRQTAEVDHAIASNRVLSAKLQPGRPLAKPLPEEPLGHRHFATKLPGAVNDRTLRRRRAPSTALRAVPLPVPGRQLSIPPHALSLSFTTAPPRVSRTALPISSSSTGRPVSLSQKAERKL